MTTAEKDEAQAAADAAGLPLAEWMRAAVLKAARRPRGARPRPA